MFDVLSVSFLRIAFIGAILSAGSTALISPFVALKKISYMSEAFAHISFAGIALALLLGIGLNAPTLIFVLIIALIIGFVSRRFSLEEANITTVFLSVSMALGIILISVNSNVNVDIAGYLFGNILLVRHIDIYWLSALFIINLIFIIIFFKELFYIAYNEELSLIYGIPVKPLYYTFIGILALNIVVSVKIIGIVLITAQLILPGLTALNFIRKLKPTIIVSVVISLISSVSGFFLSYYFDLPTGASIVLILFAVFLVSLFFRNRHI
ncbi:MAG: metal ABC transporter permease [candidate division WOR-3 bacterium]|nr:metal ABC transporter permease [candidate division WOR-3 bacterium]